MRRARLGVALALGLVAAAPASAQLSVNNLAVAQAGRSRLFQPQNRTDFYDQLNLEAAYGNARVGVRYESDENSEQAWTYRAMTQRFAEWTDRGLRVRAGNIYTLLGRGLVQRAFELPGVVLDEPGLLSRYGFSRDLDGVLVEGTAGPFSTRLLSGRTNTGATSPGTEPFTQPRYQGQIAGGQAALAPWRGSRLGVIYVRQTDLASRQNEVGSGFAELDPLRFAGVEKVALPLYAEYAQLDRSWEQWWRLKMGDRIPHAFYASSNLLWGPLALAAEWKDYRKFQLGFNDPPSLVREQSFTLLNRSTHLLDARSEHGIQLEGSWSVPEWGSVLVNESQSAGTPSNRTLRYESTYWEAHGAPARWTAVEGTLYLERGLDEGAQISDRDTYGGSVTVRALRDWSATLDLARKDQTLKPAVSFSDRYLSCGVARAQWGSATLVWERTNDPREGDPVRDVDPQVHTLTFVSAVVNARLTERHQATLTFGKRRGGLACTAGTCYVVEPFKGAELRLTARL